MTWLNKNDIINIQWYSDGGRYKKMCYSYNQQTIDNEDDLDIFEYYRKFGLVATCDKFNISEEDLFQAIVARYGEVCNNITSYQLKSATRNILKHQYL